MEEYADEFVDVGGCVRHAPQRDECAVVNEIEVCYTKEDGEVCKVLVFAIDIGTVLINLETTREMLGHTNLTSTLRYTHGLDGVPAFDFVKYILLRENRGGRHEDVQGV